MIVVVVSAWRGSAPPRPLRPTTSSAAGMSVAIVQPRGVVISVLFWRRSRSSRLSSAAVMWRSSRCCATGRSCSISITPSSKSRRRDTPEIRAEIKRADRAEIRRRGALTPPPPLPQAEGLCLADEVIGNDEIAEIIAKFTAKSIRLFLWIDGVFTAPCISTPPPNFVAVTGGLQVQAAPRQSRSHRADSHAPCYFGNRRPTRRPPRAGTAGPHTTSTT